MSKVLIDRELLSVASLHLEYSGYTETGKKLRALLDTPSGTPAMPVKAYYHEWTDLEGVRTRSVGLEVRKEFTDAPLVLESDALARIACLEGEIAKRDARIMGLESQYQRDVYGLNNEGDPIGGDPAGGYANDNARLRTELAALKAQEPVGSIEIQGTGFLCAPFPAPAWAGGRQPAVGTKLYAAPVSEAKAQDTVGEVVGWYRLDRPYEMTSYPSVCATWHKLGAPVAPLYAAPVQQVSVPDDEAVMAKARELFGWAYGLGGFSDAVRDLVAFAAPAAPAADAGLVDMYRHLQTVTPYRFKKIQDASVTDGGDVLYFHKDRFDAALLDDMAANCAKESK